MKRRAILSAPMLLAAQSPNDRIRVAVIGVGNRGAFLLKHTLAIPGVKVVAVCDLEPERLEAAAKASGATPYTDFRRMLDERKDIDAVIIATPVDTHKMISIAALEVGKHVYCEKPMAASVEDAQLMRVAARGAKGIFQAGFQLRHDPNRAAAVKHVLSGAAGKVLFCQGYRHTGDLPRTTGWYFDRNRSGDNIVEQACHILDLFRWAIGQDPLRAFGSGGVSLYKDVPPGRTTMDNYIVVYEFPGDVRVEFSHLYFDPPGFSGIKERVFCEKGAVDLAAGTWSELGRRGAVALVTEPSAGADMNRLSLAEFFNNARGRKQPLNNADSAWRSTMMAILGRKAIYDKRVVEWSEITTIG